MTESVLKVRSSYENILASLYQEKIWAGKVVYNFLGKDEKHEEFPTYFRLKRRCGKEVYPNKNHVTSHPFGKLMLRLLYSLKPKTLVACHKTYFKSKLRRY